MKKRGRENLKRTNLSPSWEYQGGKLKGGAARAKTGGAKKTGRGKKHKEAKKRGLKRLWPDANQGLAIIVIGLLIEDNSHNMKPVIHHH